MSIDQGDIELAQPRSVCVPACAGTAEKKSQSTKSVISFLAKKSRLSGRYIMEGALASQKFMEDNLFHMFNMLLIRSKQKNMQLH